MLLHARVRHGWADAPMVLVTTSGTKGSIWIACALLAYIFGSEYVRFYAVLSLVTLLLAEGWINFLLKPAVRRERPYVRNRLSALLVKAPGAHSWPSAHAGSSIAAAIVLAVGLWPWGLALVPFALLVGYSRVYVGVHYPLDVLSGFAVGVATALLTLGLAAILHSHLP